MATNRRRRAGWIRRLLGWTGTGIFTAAWLAAIGFLATAEGPARPVETADRARKVRTAAVESAPKTRQVRAFGVTRARRQAALSFTIPGRIDARLVEIGDDVDAGQPVAKLDDREIRHALAAAKAQLAELDARLTKARNDVERVVGLLPVNGATEEQVEAARTAVTALQARREALVVDIDEWDRKLDETELKAPFAGTILGIALEQGEYAGVAQPVVVIASREVEVEVELDETTVNRIDPDAPVTVDLPMADAEPVRGVIRSMSRSGMGPGRLFPVVVTLAGRPGIRPGLTAEVLFDVPQPAAVTVPVGAVMDPSGRSPRVFRVGADQTISVVPIEVGRLYGERVALGDDRAPLRVGEQVVVGGQASLVAGDRVEVVR
jgi:RND family efflux transporter MFP subunit